MIKSSKKLHRLLQILTVVSVIGIIYGILLLPGLQTRIFSEFLQRLNAELPGRLTVDSIYLNARSQLKIRGALWTDDSMQHTPVLSLETGSIQLRPLRLLRHELPFSQVDIRKLTVHDRLLDLFSRDAPAASNSRRKNGAAVRFGDCHIRISDCHVVVSRPDAPVHGEIRNISGWMHLSASGPRAGRIELDSLTVRKDSALISTGKITCTLAEQQHIRYGSFNFMHDRTDCRASLSITDEGLVKGFWQFYDEAYVLPLLTASRSFAFRECKAGGSFQGPVDSIRFDSSVYVADDSEFTPDSLFVSCVLTHSQIRRINASVPWLDGRVGFHGELGMQSDQPSAWTLNLEDLSLQPLWQRIRHTPSPFTGHIQGKISGSGPGLEIRQWSGQGTISLEDISYQKDPAAPLHAVLRFSSDSIQVFAKQGITQTFAQLLPEASGPRASYYIQNIRTGLLAPWVNLTGFHGQIHGHGEVRGTWEMPEGTLHLTGDNLGYRFLIADTLLLESGFHRRGPDRIRLKFHAHTDTTANRMFPSDPFHGKITVHAEMDGSLDALRGYMKLNGRMDEYRGFRVDTLSLQTDIRDGQLAPWGFFIADSSRIAVNGQMRVKPLAGVFELTVDQVDDSLSETIHIRMDSHNGIRFHTGDRGFALALASPFYQALPALGGRLTLHGNFNPHLKHKTGLLNFRCLDLPLSVHETGNVTGTIRYYRDVIQMSGAVSCMHDLMSLEGEIRAKENSFPSDMSVQGRLRGQIRSLSPYIQMWAPHISIQGKLTTDVELTGPLRHPGLYGKIDLNDGQIDLEQQQRFAESIQLETRLNGDSLEAGLKGRIGTQRFSLQGKASGLFASSPTWHVSWQSDSSQLRYQGHIGEQGWEGSFRASAFSLQYLQPVLPSLYQLNGKLNAGFSFHPNVHGVGFIALEDVSFSLPEIPVELSRGTLRIGLDDETLHVDSLSAEVNDGFYLGSGTYAHQGFRQFAGTLQVTGGQSRFRKPDVYQILLDSLELTLASNRLKHQLSGQLILGKSKFTQSIRLKDFPAWIDRTRSPWKKPSDFQKNLQLNVRIAHSKPFWIDNNLARLKMKSTLAAYGSLASPYFMGNLSVQEGYVLYLDRKFEVTRGELIFSNPESPFPEVDFSGKKVFKAFETYSGNQYTVSLTLSGPLNRVGIQWASDPSLAEADILTLLTLGATRRELTRDDSEGWGTNLTDVLQDRLALISSQQVSSYTTRTLGDMFGLEEVAVEGNLFKFGKSWGPQLLASKKISDRFTLTYRTAVGKSNVQDIRLDYRLTQKFSLEGQTDQDGKSGLDLIYKLRF